MDLRDTDQPIDLREDQTTSGYSYGWSVIPADDGESFAWSAWSGSSSREGISATKHEADYKAQQALAELKS